MRQMGSATDMPSPGYASLESPRGQDDYRPAGGVPLFSNLPPVSSHTTHATMCGKVALFQSYLLRDPHLAIAGI